MTSYCFVLDLKGKRLRPTKENRGWYLIRKGKATLVQKYPMVIQLNYEVNVRGDTTETTLGIDDGSKQVGIALVQKGLSRNKVIFKGTIELRQDVSHLMDVRRWYRNYRRQHKRYRKPRFLNRRSSKRLGRIPPSIKQKKDSILRVVRNLLKWCCIDRIVLEDVKIDIRALTEGYKPYRWEYQKSNRMDENIRKAVLLRDNHKCQKCFDYGCRLEVHHIIPRRLKGSDSIYNLITLCESCHRKITGVEEDYIDFFKNIIDGLSVRLDYASHVMQGKIYLRSELSKIAPTDLLTGGDTANYRIDLGISKSHSNDAAAMCGLFVTPNQANIKAWSIKPMRKRSKAKVESVKGFKHRDLIEYVKRNGVKYLGYITALYPDRGQFNMTTIHGVILKRYTLSSVKLKWRYNKIYWFETVNRKEGLVSL